MKIIVPEIDSEETDLLYLLGDGKINSVLIFCRFGGFLYELERSNCAGEGVYDERNANEVFEV